MMKKDDHILKLDFSEEFLLESAEKRFDAGDYLGALTMLNKRAEMYPPCADASALYGDIYENLELYSLSADAWFRFLDTCNEADFPEGYEGLAVAFMNMGEDVQSDIFYRRAFDVEESALFEELIKDDRPELRLVHDAEGSIGDPELLQKGLLHIRSGELENARSVLSEIPPESADYASASGLSALCMMLEGNTEGAAAECERLLERHPDNVAALTTYCAVLGAQGDTEGAKRVGSRLAEVETQSVEDLFRVATALCETGLDEKAYEKLTALKEKLPYNDDVLWFHAVSACKTGRREEAIASLERLTTVYPRKAVAKYYLVRLRAEENVEPTYFYRLPDDEYKTLAGFFLSANGAKQENAERYSDIPDIDEYFRLAFDQLDGRDEKLQALAAKVAVKCRCDNSVRDILLDYNADEALKLSILYDLVLRNEENSFGTVICNMYREFFTHKIGIGEHKRKQFLNAFADVYSKFALFGEECENKIIDAAEDVYYTLEAADMTDYFEEREALSAVIFREARLKQGERSIEKVAALFGANLRTVKDILNYLI